MMLYKPVVTLWYLFTAGEVSVADPWVSRLLFLGLVLISLESHSVPGPGLSICSLPDSSSVLQNFLSRVLSPLDASGTHRLIRLDRLSLLHWGQRRVVPQLTI